MLIGSVPLNNRLTEVKTVNYQAFSCIAQAQHDNKTANNEEI
jgi:hypothetical protein